MTDAKVPEEAAEKEQHPPPSSRSSPSLEGAEGESTRSAKGSAKPAGSTEEGRRTDNGGSKSGLKAASSESAERALSPDSASEQAPKKKAKTTKTKETADADAKVDKGEQASPLLHKGNPLRWARGGVTAGLGAVFTYLLMAQNGQLRIGVPLGALFVIVSAWGVMDLLGTFDDADDGTTGSTSLGDLVWPISLSLVTLLLFSFSLMGAASGWALPQGAWGVVVSLAFLTFVASAFELGVKLGPWAKDELGLDRPLLRRHGFWVIVAATLLYLPMLGSYSLWDPWETHYGEVSREILARDDWISLWWAQDGWFWSKPILDFWIQAIFMATLGVHYKADQMLMGSNGANAHPEWAVRAPVFLMTVLAMYLLYKGAAKAFGRRAGLLGALVLATMTDWYMLGHQTMTDMPFVAAMTAAMGLLLLGLHAPEETPAKTYEVKAGRWTVRLSGWHLVFGAILLSAIPQIVYLISRNLELVVHGNGPYGFRAHWDEFRSGSAANCGLPGNEACTVTAPASIPASVRGSVEGIGPIALRLFGAFEPVLQGLAWAAVIGTLLYVNWGERRVRRLYYLAAWFFAAIATMAKGPAGFGLPMICAFAYVCTTKRWKELLRLEMLSGLLIILAVALPWYVAMYVRHGSPFTDRLIFHDMFNRAFHHVHDTNEGDDTSFRFYVWQLGYALFPWTGLAPLGLLWWMRRTDFQGGRVDGASGKGDAAIMLLMWFLFSFALFSFMGTKFHHYIFPAVPPVAMLLGVTLDEMLSQSGEGEAREARKRGTWVAYVAISAGVLLTVVGVSHFWPGSIFGAKPEHGDLAPASVPIALLVTALGLIGVVVGSRLARGATGAASGATERTPAEPEEDAAKAREAERRRAHEQLMLSGAALAGGLLLVLIGRDLAIKPDNADQPGAIRLLHLFTYNYRRAWPDTLDFGAILTAFAIVAVVASLAMAVRAIRRQAIVVFVGLGIAWALWGLDVYMVKTAQHWGQHEVIQAYYDSRANADEPLVAYQMNWKGENFYTGNRIPAFVSSGATFTTWLKAQKEKGVHVMYFITEHGRISGLKSEVAGKAYREVTDKALCNKFVLVRAEL